MATPASSSISTPAAKTTLDLSALPPRTPAHYFAVWIWLGAIVWYCVAIAVAPLLYLYHPPALGALVAVFVAATLLPCDPALQPAWCFAFGDWVVRKVRPENKKRRTTLLDKDARARPHPYSAFAPRPASSAASGWSSRTRRRCAPAALPSSLWSHTTSCPLG